MPPKKTKSPMKSSPMKASGMKTGMKASNKRGSPRPSDGGPSRKKAKVEKTPEDILQEKIEAIKNVLTLHAEESEDIKDLLVSSANKAFEATKEDRHPFLEKYIEMMDTTLRGIIKRFQDEVTKQTNEQADAPASRDSKAALRDRLETSLEQKSAEISQKQTELSGKEEGHKATAKQLKSKRAEKMKVCGPLTQLENKLDDLDEKLAIFNKLRDQASAHSEKDKKKLVNLLMPQLKKMCGDSCLLNAAPSALQSETRSSFQTTAINEIGSQFDAERTGLKRSIEEEEAQHRGIICEVQDAEAATDAAKKAVDIARTDLQHLEIQRTDFQQQHKEAEKDLKNHDKLVKSQAEELQSNVVIVEELRQVYSTMQELRNRSAEVIPAEVEQLETEGEGGEKGVESDRTEEYEIVQDEAWNEDEY